MSTEKKKRNVSIEIKDLQSRKEFNTLRAIHLKLDHIQNSIDKLSKDKDKTSDELFKYIPVALVGAMQSFLRSTIAGLINSNEDILINAQKLFDTNNIKLDYEVIKHFHKREFNAGEFISYQLPISSWENIQNHFNKLLNKDFLEELKALKTRNTYSGFVGTNPNKFGPNVDVIINDLKKVFEIRHIICHEMALGVKIDTPEIWRIFTSVKTFLSQVNNYARPILYPDLNIEESILAENAKQRYLKLNDELNELVELIKKNPRTSGDTPIDIKLFVESQEHWGKYITTYVKGINQAFGNDVFKLYYYEDLADLVEDRLDELKFEFFTEY